MFTKHMCTVLILDFKQKPMALLQHQVTFFVMLECKIKLTHTFILVGSLGSRPTAIQRNPFTPTQLEREALLLEEKLKQQPPVAHAQSNRLLPHQVRDILL